ncbi:hypothetical protein AB835_04285 [Candidatus Endobugula sertula]|uniref:DUF3326 domain-containing protein n=1 Tax=Candidatus Endobugula sertula TaxID=62101 RepID=A0A1D2QRU2_9GAMM|nr:hypothetical protein AB835_04285 [Candidatus Endobugula sertula]
MASLNQRVRTWQFNIHCPAHQRNWTHISQRIAEQACQGFPIRIIVIDTNDELITVEASFLIGDRKPIWPSLLSPPRQLRHQSSNTQVVVSIIPTGVRAEIGGFAGDATPSMNLLASVCDYLVVNPNTVTASDLYFASDNIQYVEGNLICRFMLGQLGLLPVCQQTVGLVVEKPREENFLRNVQNAVNAMRTVAGVDINPVVVTDKPIRTTCTFSDFGHASGEYGELDELYAGIDVVCDTAVQAVGLVTSLDVSDAVRNAYYAGQPIPNPWGAAEAILTHLTTSFYPVTAAHSPLLLEAGHTMFGTLGDPRDGAELISSAFLCSMVRGLSQSPKVLPIENLMEHTNDSSISVSDVSAVVMPESVVGNIPFFTAMELNIPVILVRDNSTIFNVTPERIGIDLSKENIHIVNSYAEAAGLLIALREGINPHALKRPVSAVELTHLV